MGEYQMKMIQLPWNQREKYKKLRHKSKMTHFSVLIRHQSCHIGLFSESIQNAGIFVALCILVCCLLISTASATGTGSLAPASDGINDIGGMDPIMDDDRPSVRGSITSSVAVSEVQTYLNQSGSESEPAPGWKFRGNLNNTGEYDDGGIRPGNVKLWEFDMVGSPSSPVIVDDVVYIGCSDHKVYALNAETGEKIWEFIQSSDDFIGHGLFSAPAVTNNVLYIGCRDGKVYALNAETGEKIWENFVNCFESSPTVLDNIVYIAGDKVYALNAETGEDIWDFDTNNEYLSSPAVSNGIVYVGSRPIYALNAETGEKIWEHSVNYYSFSSPVAYNGIIYVGCSDQKIYAFNADTGEVIWDYYLGDFCYDSSLCVSDGIVYLEGSGGIIYAFNADTGEEIWEIALDGLISRCLSIANGVIYIHVVDIGDDDSVSYQLYALSAITGDIIWDILLESFEGSINVDLDCLDSNIVVANGKVYVANSYETFSGLSPFGDVSTDGINITNVGYSVDTFKLHVIGDNFIEQPLANFTANITSGTAPLTVQFTDSSINSPTSWIWTFGDGETSISQNPSHTYVGSGTYSVSLTATNTAGSDTETKAGYINVTSPDTGNNLPLYPGWNFISVPKILEDGCNTPIWLDQYINPQAHSMWGYNGETASWVQMMADDPIIPLDGYWLWNAEETTVHFTFKDMGQQLPPTKNLFSGWNAIGFTAIIPATARDTLLSVRDAWVSAIGFDGLGQRYENGIINGGSGEFADIRDMYPGHGYWLYMDDDGILNSLL